MAETARFPSEIRTFLPKVDLEMYVMAAHINALQVETEAIERTLGTNPQGVSGTVKNRIAAIEARPEPEYMLTFSKESLLIVGPGKGRLYLPHSIQVLGVRASVSEAPTGTDIRVDLNRNGTTMFTTQSSRPRIAINTVVSSEVVPQITAAAVNDYLTVDIDSVGSTFPGRNLVVVIRYKRQ